MRGETRGVGVVDVGVAAADDAPKIASFSPTRFETLNGPRAMTLDAIPLIFSFIASYSASAAAFCSSA